MCPNNFRWEETLLHREAYAANVLSSPTHPCLPLLLVGGRSFPSSPSSPPRSGLRPVRGVISVGPGWRGGCPSQRSSPWHDLIERSRGVVSGPRFCLTYTGSRPRGYDAEGQLGFGLIRYVGKLGTRCPSGYGAGPLAPWQHRGPAILWGERERGSVVSRSNVSHRWLKCLSHAVAVCRF